MNCRKLKKVFPILSGILLTGCDLLAPAPQQSQPPQPPLSVPPPVPSILKEVVSSKEPFIRQFRWRHGSKPYTWELQIPNELYTYYRQKPRPPTKNYSVYVTDPYDDQYIGMFVKSIKEAAIRDKMGVGRL